MGNLINLAETSVIKELMIISIHLKIAPCLASVPARHLVGAYTVEYTVGTGRHVQLSHTISIMLHGLTQL